MIVVPPHSSPVKTVEGRVRVGKTERRQQLSHPMHESKCIPHYLEVHDIAKKKYAMRWLMKCLRWMYIFFKILSMEQESPVRTAIPAVAIDGVTRGVFSTVTG